MSRFPGDVKFILWVGLFGAVVLGAVLPLRAIVEWISK